MTRTVAERIRTARLERGLTQVDLAVLAGVSPATVHRTEAGRSVPTPGVLAALLAALGLAAEEACA